MHPPSEDRANEAAIGAGVIAPGVEWPTVTLIAACHAVWLAAGLSYAMAPVPAMALLAVTIVLHASLQHEAIHRHPTARDGWNELLVALPLGLLVPYRRFRRQHLLHHRDESLTDPYDDPESYYLARGDWQRLPRAVRRLLKWNNTLAGRMLVGPAIMATGFLRRDAKALLGAESPRADRGDDGVGQIRIAWALHGVGAVAVVLIVRHMFAMPLGAYCLAAYLAQALLAVRSFCEHQWAEDTGARTVIVERSLLGVLFLNNNLHLVHHARPGLAWYALPSAYRARRAQWQAANGGYVFRSYGEVARRFGLRAKEPVPHPARTGR